MPQLTRYESVETQKIRYNIADLAKKLKEIEAHIDAYYQAMYAFECEYQQRLGDLADTVTYLRQQLGMTEGTDNHFPAMTQLANDDYRQLKQAYRQAAKLCHPDQLEKKDIEIGLVLFDQLNKYYRLQDLVQVEHILWLLQSHQAFSETPIVITSGLLLLKRESLLTLLITQRQDELKQLKMREDYDVSNRDNWNILLYDYQTQLEDELAMLRGRASIKPSS